MVLPHILYYVWPDSCGYSRHLNRQTLCSGTPPNCYLIHLSQLPATANRMGDDEFSIKDSVPLDL
jgi:hypothetical protein